MSCRKIHWQDYEYEEDIFDDEELEDGEEYELIYDEDEEDEDEDEEGDDDYYDRNEEPWDEAYDRMRDMETVDFAY